MKYMNNHYGCSRIFGKAHFKTPILDGMDGGGAGGGAGGGSSSGGESAGDAGSDQENAGGTEGAQGAQGTSFDDFLKDPKNQAEFDRRVEKAISTSRSKIEAEIEERINNARTEAEKMAKMNADQKAQYEREKKEAEIAKREAEITRRELAATAKETLAEKGLPLALAAVLNYENAEKCTESIKAVEEAFQAAVQQAVNDKLAGGKPPKKAPEGVTFTKEQISSMSAEEVNKNWDAVQAALKASK